MENIVVRGAKIRYRNFSGRETQYNRAGDRNFSWVIEDEDLAQKLIDDGWNVKIKKPSRDPQAKPFYVLPVAVSYKCYAPTIILKNAIGERVLDEETIGILDTSEIKKIKLEIRPRTWEVGGKKGVKAYLKTFVATLIENPFAHDEDDDEDTPF